MALLLEDVRVSVHLSVVISVARSACPLLILHAFRSGLHVQLGQILPCWKQLRGWRFVSGGLLLHWYNCKQG